MLPIKDRFHLPDGVIYLDGNSLGPLPKGVDDIIGQMARNQWGANLIKAWNVDGWMDQPRRVGTQIGRLIGAQAGSVTMGDTLSVKVYQALSAGLRMRPDRKVILSDSGNFPSDLYMAQGLIKQLQQQHELRIVAPDDVLDAISEDVAVVMITQVDYRTGRMHDMAALTAKAHAVGAVMLWDLAHSAGAVPVDVASCGCEFAVGCTYKFLNGGPGAPAFIYVRPDLTDQIDPALAGWLGHDAPFAFEPNYRPAPGIGRMRVGTPPVIQMTALEEAMKIWDDVTMAEVRTASIALSEQFISEVEDRCPNLSLISPRDPALRGSQVAFAFPNGYAAMQALIAQGVIGDFRAPDVMRFGITPLYLSADDISRAVTILDTVMRERLWDDPAYMTRAKVT
ncbi:MAG: kynureninase [Pseudomonadota bacterium]